MPGRASFSTEYAAAASPPPSGRTCARRCPFGPGYGLAFRVDRPTVLAVITIGYGDGLPRELSQRGGAVLIRGRRCPLAGRMCMDQLFADVTELPEVHPGDRATIIGSDRTSVIPAEEPASLCGTITNELLSALSRRLPLVYVDGRSP